MLIVAIAPHDIGKCCNDLRTVPIDDLNVGISIAADFGIREEDRIKNQFVYGVLQAEENGALVDSKYGPIGNNASHVSITPGGNWVHLTEPIVKITSEFTENDRNFNPIFKWNFKRTDGSTQDVNEVSLFISTESPGEGLYPWDVVTSPNSTPWSVSSYRPTTNDPHPNRILTYTWKPTNNSDYGYWYRADGTSVNSSPESAPTRFTLPDNLGLRRFPRKKVPKN